MKTDEVRARFLDFFKKRGHTVVKSDSLVPQNDPTLLFTGAGMNQFKEYFLGIKKDLQRAASSQKCLRTGDLEEVGRTPFHHSFFEMLGNFSFGDYFKKEAIQWGWEFLTGELKIPHDRLRITVHKKDEEAYEIWRDEIKVPADRIYKMGDKTNFWPSSAPEDGPNGPCGPCSEIYFDQDPGAKSNDIESDRFAEIWNLVFTQYDRQESGRLVALRQKNIDTGMGLERLACVLQGKKTNFEIDIFQPINEAVKRHLALQGSAPNHLYAISDHVRAVTFSITDGVIPSNEGRGYVIRKLIRRALWRAHQLIHSTEAKTGRTLEPFLHEVSSEVVRVMKGTYPELAQAEYNIKQTLRAEEERFLKTLETGLALLEEKIEATGRKGRKRLSGEEVFLLYDTYGFPDELTKGIAEKRGLEIDQKEFDRLMKEQRKRAKDASQITSSIFSATDLEKKIGALPATRFLGYQKLEARAKVLLADFQEQIGVVILDETPFYAESGGQVGDQGILENPGFRGRVTDTQKKDKCVVHSVVIEKGVLKVGESVEARVDPSRREAAMRNHTATHLLHAALRKILGTQVRQLGSLVSPEKLRFDYSYGQALSSEQLREIEDIVNQEILKDTAVTKEEKPTEEAKKEGAIAFFGEKYGDRVRVVTVPGFSKEFCAGTHCDRTGQIGIFLITNDTSIGSGVRRVEAITGQEALRHFRETKSLVLQASEKLKSSPKDLPKSIEKLQERVKQIESSSRTYIIPSINPAELLQSASIVAGHNFVTKKWEGMGPDDLRSISDSLRAIPAVNTVWFLASQDAGKVYYLSATSGDLAKTHEVNVKHLIQDVVSPMVEGSGGGREDFAQGGTANLHAFNNNWTQIIDSIKFNIKNE